MSELMYLGWDIGGAHLKVAYTDLHGVVSQVEQHATPLWQGLDNLRSKLSEIGERLPDAQLVHILTTTGELSDVFADREQGIDVLLSEFCNVIPNGEILVYGGAAGLLSTEEARRQYQKVASANWHATASYIATQLDDCVLIDIGSTTTDLIIIRNAQLANRGYTDQERMRENELLYTGLTRTPVMAVVSRVPFAGRWQSVAAELFATVADVYRIKGELDENHDLMPSADGTGKSIFESVRRLARMIGADVEEKTDLDDYYRLADYIAEKHLCSVSQTLLALLSRNTHSTKTHIVGAGVGRKLAEKLAMRHNYQYTDIEHMLMANNNQAAKAADCATAVSVALLARLAR